ncbi:MAG: flavodoxin family protein [Culturomica sp.]|jgi:multimeric flavodoxin WrbA|nr:flavodoxin family protein [Culturomica sp.]
MNVLLLHGSPREEGNTFLALSEIAKTLKTNGIESEMISIGQKAVQGCIACGKCNELDRCVFQDDLYNTVREKLKKADALIIGSPVYYAGPNGSLCALLDRLFYSCPELLEHKPGAAIAVCRRSGGTATLDRLNKYFTIQNMPVVPSQYWTCAHGLRPGDIAQDAEGLQTMRTLARNMAWLLKNLHAGAVPAPEAEPRERTNFVR